MKRNNILYKSKETIEDFSKALMIVCSNCGNIIAKKEKEEDCFDVFDCSWKCEKCGELWLSSDSWVRIGKLLIPWGFLGGWVVAPTVQSLDGRGKP